MKKVKYLFWIIIIAFIAVLVYQNKEFFLTKYILHIDVGFYSDSTPEIYNLVIIAAFAAVGMLIVYISSLFQLFKARKTIKALQNTIDTNAGIVSGLKREVDTLKAMPNPEPQEITSEEAVPPEEAEASRSSQA